MHTQINIPAKCESGVIPQQGISNTFQKDKSNEKKLEHCWVKTMMISPVRYYVCVLQRYD